MAYDLPTVPDDKKRFFRLRLIREVSQLFQWNGLEELGIPVDRIEYDLIEHGRLLFFPDDNYGHLLLRGTAHGHNIYNDPITARPIANTTQPTPINFSEKTIIYTYNQKEVVDLSQSCVLLDNMLFGESLIHVIDFYAHRMAMVWMSFDTNLLWQNIPPIISVQSPDTRLSIEKALNDIWSGKPVVIKDEALKFTQDNITVGLADVPMILKELFDAYQELYNDFKAQVGIQSTAVDKQSGVTEAESTSNNQQVRTALQVMLSQRQKFCRLVNKVYGLSLSVDVIKDEGGQEDGESDNRTTEPSSSPEF